MLLRLLLLLLLTVVLLCVLLLGFRLLQSAGRGVGETEGGEGDMSTSSSRSSALQQHDGLPRLREAPSAATAAARETQAAEMEASEVKDDREELLQKLKQVSCAAATKERLLQVHTRCSALAAPKQQHQAALDTQEEQTQQQREQQKQQ